jgi:hypothetical protein
MLRSTQSKVAALVTAATLLMPTAAMAYDPDLAMVLAATPEQAAVTKEAGPDSKEAVVLAEVKLTRQQAIASVAKLFPIPADMGEPNVSLSQSAAGAVWRLEWSSSPRAAVRKSLYATVDASTGAVLSFSRSSSESEAKELTYSRGEAHKLASEWLTKLAGERMTSLRFVDDPLEYGFYGGANAFRFHWDRMEQGYPVAGEGVDITMDARTGELTEYSQQWRSTAAFKLSATLLPQEKAYEAYRTQLPLQMQYQRYQKPGVEQGEWRLVYRTKTGFEWPAVNMEGKLLNAQGGVIDFSKIGDAKLVPAAAKPYQKPEQLLTTAEALAAAKSVSGRTDEPMNIDCSERGQEKKVSSCSFAWMTDDGNANMNVSINLETGVVNHYSNWVYRDNRGAQPTLTEEQARAKAVEFLLTHRPDLAGKVLMQPSYRQADSKEPVYSYYISFQMTHNFVPVAGQAASMEFDAVTGNLQYFWGDEFAVNENEPMPELTGLLKQEAAINSFLQAKGLELTWMGVLDEAEAKRLMMTGRVDAANQEMTLVWAPKRNMPVEAIGAQNGVMYDYSGRDLVQAAMRPTDIEGHAAQREIELLWARGIFELKDGKFNPEQTVSAAELARWMVLARGLQPYMAYDYGSNFAMEKAATGARLANSAAAPYFGAALQAGILLPEDFSDDADPNAPVSRELYALWATRAMGFGAIAKMENRIAMPFADQTAIGAKYYNAVAVLHGLKVIKGDAAATFGPQQLVTRGDAAKILFAVASRGSGSVPYWK